MHLTDGASQYGSILTVHIYKFPIDHAIAGQNTILRSIELLQVEVRIPGCDISTDLNEA